MEERDRPQARRSPLTCLVWVLAVILVIQIIGLTVIFVFHRYVQMGSERAFCGKNQSGIFAALVAYQDGGQPGWPDARRKLGLPGVAAIPAGETCARYTAGIFEILADQFRESGASHLFVCSGVMEDRSRRPRLDLQPSAERPDTAWGWGACKVPYAMDWSAPADAGAARVLLSDRDATNHRDGRVTVCYADGHYTSLPSQPATAVPGVTRSLGYGDGEAPARVLAGGDGDQEPDDIYDDAGDAIPGRPEANRTPGGGHPRRAIMW